MTSRELLACALIAVPALTTRAPRVVAATVVPALAVGRRRCRPRRLAARAGGARAADRRRDPSIGDWLVVDAAGGLLVGVIGVVGLASVLVSPAYLRRRDASFVAPERRRADVLRGALRLLGDPARGAAGRESRRRLAARRGDDRRLRAAGRLQRQGRARSRRLEVPHPHLARPRRRAARDRHPRRPASPAAGSPRSPGRRSRPTPPRQRDGARRLPAPARRPRGEDRLGAGAQLAPRRALGGTAPRLGAALGGAPAGRAARRLAVRARARPCRRRADGAGRS